MAEAPSPPPSAKDPWDDAFKPYAFEIGFLVREWNGLQEALSRIFLIVLGVNGAVARAIWYAIQSDRWQRNLLREAAKATFEEKSDLHTARKRHLSKCPKILEAILWLVDKTDGIGQQRDDAIHSPVSLMLTDPPEFIAFYSFGHPRATKLKGKKLLAEIQLYREKAKILEKYARDLERQLSCHRVPWDDEMPLPEKPFLPSLEQKNQQQVSESRQVPAKERTPPPRSSPP